MVKKKKPLILVVEDETSLLFAAQRKLEDAGLETLTARDGKEALEVLSSSKRTPKVIWLDYYLPTMNGLEFLGVIKKKPRLRKIPVVVVSNTAGPEKVSAMMALGANKYFVKAEKRLDEIIKEIKSLTHEGGK